MAGLAGDVTGKQDFNVTCWEVNRRSLRSKGEKNSDTLNVGIVIDRSFCLHFCFSCLYHSTIAPYSFIHLPPTLYNVFLPALQFPLSVPFHHCSILIHQSTTHAVKCFSPRTSVSPVSTIPPLLQTHSSTYHPRCIMFFSQHFSFPLSVSFHHRSITIHPPTTHTTSVFPCQYHSTIAPYSSIHLPPTLYNVFLPALQFPLSVPFHHCSILIQPTTTHAV